MMNRAEAVKNIQAAQAKTNLNKTAGKNIQSAYPGQWLSRTGKLMIVKQKDIILDIEITGKSEIWPSNSKSSEYKATTTAKVTARKGNEALAGADVNLLIKRIEGSGGHDHTSPALPVDKCGRINSRTNGTVVLKTNTSGIIDNIEIESSEFGGDYILEASLKNSPAIKAEVEFKVRVPELKPLPSSMYYDKIGGTDKHLGPPPSSDADHNHWALETVIKSITRTAILWDDKFPTEAKLNINDMSLPYGGKFDVSGNWKGDHKDHRTVIDIDIRTNLVYYYYNIINYRIGVPVRLPRSEPLNIANNYPEVNLGLNNASVLIYNRKFEEYCEQNSGKAHIHKANTIYEHYHLDY